MNLQEQRLEILEQVDKLVAIHPRPKTKSGVCGDKNCEVCSQLKEWGAKYEALTLTKRMKDKAKEHSVALTNEEIENEKMKIIGKGMDATKSEIRFLIEVAKVNKPDAAKWIGMNRKHFFEICRNWGIGKNRKRRTAT